MRLDPIKQHPYTWGSSDRGSLRFYWDRTPAVFKGVLAIVVGAFAINGAILYPLGYEGQGLTFEPPVEVVLLVFGFVSLAVGILIVRRERMRKRMFDHT